MVIIDDNLFIKLAISCFLQVFFGVKVRQFLCVDTRFVYPAADAADVAGGGSLSLQGTHTSGSALRQWFEITNLRREAIIRGEGGSVHVYGFQRDLRQHVRLESNGLEFLMVFCVSEIFVLRRHNVKFRNFGEVYAFLCQHGSCFGN